MLETTKPLSFGDIARAFPDGRGRPLTRARLDRLLRDHARELPEPLIVGGMRLWPAGVVDALRIAMQREQEPLAS